MSLKKKKHYYILHLYLILPLTASPIFNRTFGTKCDGCAQGILPSDLVRRAKSKVFHLNCFTCVMCNKQLSTGEELYILDEFKFVCKEDYQNNNGKDTILLSGMPFRPVLLFSVLLLGLLFFFLRKLVF